MAGGHDDGLRPGTRSRHKQAPGGQFSGMLLLMAIPWLIFTMLVLSFSFAFHHYSVLVCTFVLAWVIVACLFFLLDARERMGGQWFMFLATMCLIATVNGTLAGLYNYHTHMFQYWSYAESRAYTNVLPSEPAASHADASKIVFTSSARLDTTRAVGYKASTTYCVAPILDEASTRNVEYWAAGIDCCPARGDFACDDAWNPKARSAVVILDSDGIFASTKDMFNKAVRQAKVSYNLLGPDEPLLVRWVIDPQQVQDDCWRGGIGFLVAFIFIYLLISIISGAMLHMWAKRAATTANTALAAHNQALLNGGGAQAS